jgi:hypothetical protein
MTNKRIPQKDVVRAYKSQTMSIADAVGEGGADALVERAGMHTGKVNKKVLLFKNFKKQPTNKGKRPAAKRKRCK